MAGIRLQGEGRDAANKYFRGYTSTKTDGTYELKIYPNQPTLIAVTDEHVAAQSIETLPMAEGKLLENVDLKVGRGVLISGTFTVGDDNRPAIDQTATLIQQGSNGSQLVRWCQTDKSGRYVFRVGPGDYSLRLMDDKELNVAVKDENLEFDCDLKRLPRGPLSGKVTDGDGKPVSSLLIIKSISTATHGSFKVQSKSDGTFATEKYNDPIRVIAICAEQRLFGMREIEADAETVDIVVAPAASLNCVVLDAQDKPLEGCRVIANQGLGGLQNDIETQTDANGKCTFPAVGTGFTWTISANSDGERKSIRFKVEEAKSYDVPALKMSNVNAKQE